MDEGIQWGKALEAFHGPLDYSGWEEPLKPDTTNLKSWERHTRVDRLQDFIPFWRDGVYAALEGREVPKSEEFFNRIYSEEDAWGLPVDDEKVEVNPWAAQDIGWEAEFTGWVDEAEKWGPKDEAAGWVDQDDAGGWGASPDNGKHGSEETAKGRSDGEAVTALHAEDANSFVDQVARLEHASGQRKERMRQFYAVSHSSLHY